MSNFFTPIPVDLAAIKKLLPPDAYVDPVLRWNKDANRVEIHWSSSLLKSPYSFAHEFTTVMLKARSLPQHVTALPAYPEATGNLPTETIPPIIADEAQPEPEPVIANEKPVDAQKKRGKNKTV